MILYDIAFAGCDDYDHRRVRDSVEAALAKTAELGWLAPGMTVAVKANLVTAARPDRAATTHPAVLRAVCGAIADRGARPVVGDSPGGPYAAAWLSRVYAACGLEGVCPLNRDFSVRRVSNPGARVCRDFDCTGWLLDADAVVSVCKLKTHGMMAMTAGVKNMFGAIPGTEKPEYHFRYPRPEDFAGMLVDLCEYFRPRFTVCDAVEAMEGNGPTAGRPRHLGCIAAAQSPYMLDECLAQLIGLEPLRVPTIAETRCRGLSDGGWRAADMPDAPAGFEIPDAGGLDFGGSGALGRLRSAFLAGCLASRPQLDAEKCAACAQCAAICPAKAIEMRGGRPHIDRKKCIRCFCCQEFCPAGALRARRPAVARMLVRGSG